MIPDLLLLFPGLALLSAPALWFVLGRPRYLRDIEPGDETSRISIVIPARNEEDNLPALLESIARQSVAPHQILVVDDDSTDRTAEIARDEGAEVIPSRPLPADWNGKPWACQQGAAKATGDWLLFLDSDTRLEPEGLGHLEGLTSKPDTVFSVCPHHAIAQPYEELSAFFNVLMVAGVNAFGVPRASQPALFGQCLLISREHYERVGGHEPVRKEVLENFCLAEHLGRIGLERSCLLGSGALSMRMFPGGLADLWQGWRKSCLQGASRTARRALVLSSVWISGGMFAIVSLFLLLLPFATPALLPLVALAYLTYALQCAWVFRMAGSFSLLNALLFPVSLLFYQALFLGATIARRRGKEARWKGRTVT